MVRQRSANEPALELQREFERPRRPLLVDAAVTLGGVFPFFSDHGATNAQTAPGGGFDVYTVKVQ